MLYGTIICLILLLYIFVLLRPGKAAVYPDAVLVDYAHRGAFGDGIPENSLAAFARAADNGCGIELDVQLSKDGQVMVFHDTYLERMTGMPGKCGDYTAMELSAMRLADTEETIPTFQDVLALVNGRVPILVELKGESLDTAVCAPTAELLRAYSGEFIVESFNPCLLGWFARHEPEMIRGLLYTNVTKQNGLSPLSLVLGAMLLNRMARPQFLACDGRFCKCLAPWLFMHLYRTPVWVWTLSSKAQQREWREKGMRSIYEGFLPRTRS